jgi:hypothetical protein
LSFWCASCDLELDDGVDYTFCPKCNGPVEACEIARTQPVALPTPRHMSRVLLGVMLVVQAGFALANPYAFPYLRTVLIIAQLAALPSLLAAIAFAPTILALLTEQTRILHGLEHATIAVLAEQGIAVHSGVTLPGLFDLALPNGGRNWERMGEIRAAAIAAIQRVSAGDHALAYSEHCGTSYAVGILSCGLAIAAIGAVALIRGTPPGYAFAGTVAALAIARATSRRLGLLAQRTLTVSTRLASAQVGEITREVSPDGSLVYFAVHVTVVATHIRLQPRVRGDWNGDRF